MVQKVMTSNPAWVNSQLKNSFCQSNSKWVSFLNQGRIRQQKKRDGLHLSYAVPKIY